MENLNNNTQVSNNQDAIQKMFNLLNERVMPKKMYNDLLNDLQEFAQEVNETIFYKRMIRLEFIKNMN